MEYIAAHVTRQNVHAYYELGLPTIGTITIASGIIRDPTGNIH